MLIHFPSSGSNMDAIFMKKGVLLFMIFRFLVSGLEEYMILPTAWIYIRSLGETEVFLGITLASHGLAVAIFMPILGHMTNRYRCPKLILLVCHLLRVCGNALYSVSTSPYYALIGRTVCGISAASDVLLLGELARTTQAKHRAKTFFLLDGIYILGCALGPIFATILTFELNIFSWKITSENSPGFALAAIWLLIFLITIFLPSNFSQDEELSDSQLVLTPSGFADAFREDPQKTAVDRSQILCLLSYIFFIWFFASVTAFDVPILATELFNLGQFHINLLFGNSLLFQMVFYLFCHIARERLNAKYEGVLLLVAIFVQGAPLGIMAAFGIKWGNNVVYLLLVYILLGTPMVALTLARSLLSKIFHPQLTAYYQRLSYTSHHLATVVGRVLAAFFFGPSLFGWLALQLALLWVMITISYTLVFFMKY